MGWRGGGIPEWRYRVSIRDIPRSVNMASKITIENIGVPYSIEAVNPPRPKQYKGDGLGPVTKNGFRKPQNMRHLDDEPEVVVVRGAKGFDVVRWPSREVVVGGLSKPVAMQFCLQYVA